MASKLHTELSQKIVSLLKTLPKDRIKHYASFKDVQLERFQNPEVIKNISEQDLKLQYISLRDLVNDKYKNYYQLDDKLLKPKGNPQYYERLMREIRGDNKESVLTGLRTVLFGK
jgi:cytochrome b pre-mRNA-processing protein 6